MPASLPVNQTSSPDRDHARPVRSLHSRVNRRALPARSVTATYPRVSPALGWSKYAIILPSGETDTSVMLPVLVATIVFPIGYSSRFSPATA